MENGLHLIYLYADSATEWNCSQWRCLTPSDAINAEHEKGTTPMTAQLFFMPTALGWDHPEVQRKLGAGDVLIFQRNVIIPEVWHAIDYWRALGKTIVIDLDDAYPDLMPSNPAFPYWILNKPGIVPDPVKGLEEGLRRAHALTSPSRIILRDWEHAVRGFHLPNWTRRVWYEDLERKPVGGMDYLFSHDDTGMLFAEPREGSEGQVILGWGGSISHVDSWLYSGIVEALDRIFEKHPHARLKFCGHEKRLDDLVLSRWGDKVIRQGGVQPKDWPKVVSTFDIGLAPLDPRPLPPWREGAPVVSYDDRRSWLKAAEYLTAGVPWAASKSETYKELAHLGHIVDNTPDAWFGVLSYMIRLLPEMKAEAWKRRKRALDGLTLEGNIGRYNNIMDSIVATAQVSGGAKLPGVAYIE